MCGGSPTICIPSCCPAPKTTLSESVNSVKEGNGLEAMRLLMKRYEPRTPGTKRTLLKAIMNNPASKKPDELEKNPMKMEEYMKHYEVMAGADLPEDLKAR